jgi:membrane-bound lytic murein transglycosylase B
MKTKKSPAAWAQLGVRDITGKPVPNHGTAAILMPGGAQGAAFMIFKNFNVIERYNAADAYVIGVGHLSDRIMGGPAIQSSWPRQYLPLKLRERKELQRRLTRKGFDTQGVDGKIGPNTISAIRDFQKSIGVTPDGYASIDVLKRLR